MTLCLIASAKHHRISISELNQDITGRYCTKTGSDVTGQLLIGVVILSITDNSQITQIESLQ